jgi:tRNA(fMet)-specific endonuclease VapC
MTPPAALLDTDILSAIMRGRAAALARGQIYLASHRCFTLSIITRYEVLRGLHARAAAVQIAAFDRFSAANRVLPITDPIVVRAATIYGRLHQQGALIADADILIAASALEHGLAVVTNNEAHFTRIPGLAVENWLRG